eukprot:Sspe_Gene.38996::Locus_18815_Transcript_1_1_Confidence_1.000_Length_2012::g.38996::m.38996
MWRAAPWTVRSLTAHFVASRKTSPPSFSPRSRPLYVCRPLLAGYYEFKGLLKERKEKKELQWTTGTGGWRADGQRPLGPAPSLPPCLSVSLSLLPPLQCFGQSALLPTPPMLPLSSLPFFTPLSL